MDSQKTQPKYCRKVHEWRWSCDYLSNQQSVMMFEDICIFYRWKNTVVMRWLGPQSIQYITHLSWKSDRAQHWKRYLADIHQMLTPLWPPSHWAGYPKVQSFRPRLLPAIHSISWIPRRTKSCWHDRVCWHRYYQQSYNAAPTWCWVANLCVRAPAMIRRECWLHKFCTDSFSRQSYSILRVD